MASFDQGHVGRHSEADLNLDQPDDVVGGAQRDAGLVQARRKQAAEHRVRHVQHPLGGWIRQRHLVARRLAAPLLAQPGDQQRLGAIGRREVRAA